jgi:hypothetical protein
LTGLVEITPEELYIRRVEYARMATWLVLLTCNYRGDA